MEFAGAVYRLPLASHAPDRGQERQRARGPALTCISPAPPLDARTEESQVPEDRGESREPAGAGTVNEVDDETGDPAGDRNQAQNLDRPNHQVRQQQQPRRYPYLDEEALRALQQGDARSPRPERLKSGARRGAGQTAADESPAVERK